MRKRAFPIVAWSLMVAMAPVAYGQHGHDDEDLEGLEEEFVMPETYREAVEEIDHYLHEISELMESKKLDGVPAQAEGIQKIAKVIGPLARKAGSGVPTGAVPAIETAGRILAAKFHAIDKAADSGNAAGTHKVYMEMVELGATLQKYVRKVYTCPMAEHLDETDPAKRGPYFSTEPGKCPLCGMELTELKAHADHQAKHGGMFFMAPDKKHHLEATLSPKGEFRIYFYDEFTVPMLADRFTAKGTVWKEGTSEADRRPFAMSLEHEKAFLTGRIPTFLTAPLSMKVFIDFKDGKKPQVFDFDFDEYSKAHTEEMHGGKHKSPMEHEDDKHKGHKP